MGDWYEIKKSRDQVASLGDRLSGKTRDEVAKKGRKSRGDNDKHEPTARVRIPLAVNTETLTANGTVTVASLPGEEIDLDGVEDMLNAAIKAVREAKKKGISAKVFAAAMKDMAAAG